MTLRSFLVAVSLIVISRPWVKVNEHLRAWKGPDTREIDLQGFFGGGGGGFGRLFFLADHPA